MYIIKNKREKVSKCNICGCEDKMTWDHIPPKGAILVEDIEMLSIMNMMTIPQSESQPFLQSQNGMKFRTICEKCNNTLGHKYDREFNSAIAKLTRSSLNAENDTITAQVDTEKMLKSICGHLLAAKIDYEETLHDQRMRDFVLDRSIDLGLNVYYWVYPFIENVVVRDILLSRFFFKENAMISIFKCFPIAFLITDSEMFETEFTRLSVENNLLRLNRNPIYPADYPIRVEDETAIFGGKSMESALIARPIRR